MAESMVEREGETSLSAARRCLRLALRGLVVAGFAGGVWLLSSSAAHAAGPQGTAASDSTGPVANPAAGAGGDGLGGLLGLGLSASAAPLTGTLAGIVTHSDAMGIPRTGGAFA